MDILPLKKYKLLIATLYAIGIAFALFGFLLTVVFFAVKFGFTNISGSIDLNDREITSIYKTTEKEKNSDIKNLWCGVMALSQYAPVNGSLIAQYLRAAEKPTQATRMIEATLLRASQKEKIQSAIEDCQKSQTTVRDTSLFAWMNTPEWHALAQALIKDAPVIQKVAQETGVPSRLITMQVIGEQMRLFTSDRELFKQVFSPLKILGSETQFSLGVSGIKEETAKQIEENLRNPSSPYYIGKQYEHVLDFQNQDDATNERITRITDSRNHYYAYLYTALFIKQVETQWKSSGFDISDRPEILATLFNIGFAHSIPNANPQIGGAPITIDGREYTFGSIGYDFYYSGELQEQFPL